MITITTIADCQAGKRRAQKILFETYGRRLFGVAHRYLNNEMDAEDAVAKAFFKVYRSIGRSSFASVEKFEAWLMKILINEALAILRKRPRFPTQDLSTCINKAYENENIIAELSTEEVLTLIRGLPDGYRTVLNLYAMEGYSHPEISELLNISVGTSRSQLSKARKLLRERIQQLNLYEYRTI